MKHKKISTITCGLILSVLLSSCYVQKMIAPLESKVALADEMEQLPVKVKYTQWYILWGLVPLSNDKTDDKIQKYKLTKVRVTTKQSFLDGFCYWVWGGLIAPQTVILEGISEISAPNNESKKQSTENQKTKKQDNNAKSQTSSPSTKSKSDRLRELKEMLDSKLISQDDYEREKKKILSE